MALEMRKSCERCSSVIEENALAYICVFECTFCQPYTEEMNHICPNCGGELVKRPRKPSKVSSI